MRTNLISPCVPVLVSSLAPLFRHAGRGVVVRHRPLLVASCAVIVSPCLACFVSLVRAFLWGASVMSACYPLRSIVVSLGSPVCSTSEAGRVCFASRSGFALTAVACCLPCRAVEAAGRFLLVGVVHGRRVDGVGWRCDFCRFRCLPCILLSGGCCSLVPSPRSCLLRPRCRSSWANRHRVPSSWLMARRRSSWLAVPSCLPSGVVVVRVGPVARSVGSSRRSLSRPVLLVGGRGGLRLVVLSSHAARCLVFRPWRLSVAWCRFAGVLAVLAVWLVACVVASLLARLVRGRIVVARYPVACLAAGGGVWRLVLASRSPPIRISPRPPCRGAGRDFLFLSALSLCSVSR